MDLNQCRLCSKIDNTAVSVFDQVEKNLSEKIKLCFGVLIKRDDRITKKICRCCYYFTNSVYEHRIASQENDIKLKNEYEEKFAIKVEILNDLSQNDFLNNLKLTNKDDLRMSNIPVVHQSFENLKRKYPNINLPDCCKYLDLDPFVDVLSEPKRKQKKNDNTWSICNKNSTSALVLTMIKSPDNKEDDVNNSDMNRRILRRRLSSSSSNCSNISNVKITRSIAKVFQISPVIPDGNANKFDTEILKKPDPFICHKCDKKFVRKSSLTKHKCVTATTPKKDSNSPKVSLNSPKLDRSKKTTSENSETTTDLFKSPKSTRITSPVKKIANATNLKDANTDLKTLFEYNEQINDSILKLSKDNLNGLDECVNNKVSQDISKNIESLKDKEQNMTTTTKDKNLSTLAEIPANTVVDKGTLNTENSANDSVLNTSDLLVHGEEVSAFLCLTCNKVFDTLDLLKHHKRYAHKLSLRCDKCPKKFTVVETLMKHKKLHEKSEKKREAIAIAKVQKANKAKNMINEELKSSEESNSSTNATNNDDVSSETTSKSDDTVILDVVNDTEMLTPENEGLENEEPENEGSEDEGPENEGPENEGPKNLVGSITKRTTNLPQLSVTLEPLEYARLQNQSNTQLTRGRMVARKRTDGALYVPNLDEANDTSSDSDSSLSSSDEDDCKITEVFTEGIKEKEIIEPEKLVLDTALVPQSNSKDNVTTNVDVKNSKKIEPICINNEVFVIDSESDTEHDKSAPKPQLTVQLDKITDGANKEISLGDENKVNKNKIAEEGPSTSNTKNKSIRKSSFDRSSPILIPANFEESNKMSASSAAAATATAASVPNNTKITNEVNYINYLYNRCNYDEKSITNGSQYWTLQDLKKVVKNSIVCIEINKVIDQNVSIKYTTTNTKPKPAVPLIPWNYTKAIDLNGGANNKTSKMKQSHKHVAKNPKASIKVPIPASGFKSNLIATKCVCTNETATTSGQSQKKAISKNPSIQAKSQLYIIATNQIQQNQQIQQTQQIPANAMAQQIQTNIMQTQQIQANTLQTQQIQTNIMQAQHTQDNTLLQTQNIPNKNGANNIQARSILKNALTTSPQQILYTYMPTNAVQQKFVTIPTTSSGTETKQSLDQSFVINGVPYQSVGNINKNATIVIQQIDQPNFINITQPAFFAHTPESGNAAPIYLNQQTNIVQEKTVNKQTEMLVNNKAEKNEKEQMNEVSSSSLTTTQTDAAHRPMIRIKSLSELTAKPSESSSKDGTNTTYLNVFANYVNTRKP